MEMRVDLVTRKLREPREWRNGFLGTAHAAGSDSFAAEPDESGHKVDFHRVGRPDRERGPDPLQKTEGGGAAPADHLLEQYLVQRHVHVCTMWRRSDHIPSRFAQVFRRHGSASIPDDDAAEANALDALCD